MLHLMVLALPLSGRIHTSLMAAKTLSTVPIMASSGESLVRFEAFSGSLRYI